MNPEGLVWNKRIHHRFSRDDKRRIVTVLLVYERMRFTHKNVLFAYIIPQSVEQLFIPRLYVANLPPSFSVDDMERVFKVPIENSETESDGSQSIECTHWDDYNDLMNSNRQVLWGDSKAINCVIL